MWLYGLLAYLVAERTKDIDIRIALGARLAHITGSVVAGGLSLVAFGAAIGLAGSLLLLRSLGTLLFGVTPYDVPTYVIVVVLLGDGYAGIRRPQLSSRLSLGRWMIGEILQPTLPQRP